MAYLPLRITTVPAETDLTFDLYIFFKERYLCYSKKGNQLTNEKLDKLISQDFASFFIPEDQVDNYHLFIDESLNEVCVNKEMPVDQKMNLVEGIAGTALDAMESEGPTEKNFRMSNKAANSLRAVITQNPEALKQMFGKKGRDADVIINHSLEVCGLASKLAIACKLKEDELEDLATAALIHDIGLAKMPEDIRQLFFKTKSDVEPKDYLSYGSHAKDSAKLLSEKPYVNKRVEDLILNHEENLQGTGPNKNKTLTKSQEILSLVNAYDKRLIIKNESPKEAIGAFQIDEIGNYSLDLINKFKEVLKKEGLLEL